MSNLARSEFFSDLAYDPLAEQNKSYKRRRGRGREGKGASITVAQSERLCICDGKVSARLRGKIYFIAVKVLSDSAKTQTKS